jgi:hypothetical protein
MMQVQNLATTHVKNDVKAQAAKLENAQKADKAKPTEVVDLPKPQSFSRTLEAYSDCV